jgi:predicted kinase
MAPLFLLQMAGAPGTGKSTVAKALAAVRTAVVLDNDVIKSAILDAGVEWTLAGPAAYEVLFALAADLLSQGRSVILDSPSHYPHIPARGIAIARAGNAEYRFIECVCGDQAELVRRLSIRSPRRSQMRRLGEPPPDAKGSLPGATPIGVHLWKTHRPDSGYLSVDTAAPVASYLPKALIYLDS